MHDLLLKLRIGHCHSSLSVLPSSSPTEHGLTKRLVNNAELGIKDSVEAFYDDTAKSARDMLRPDLVTVLTGRSASAVEWLQDKFKLDLSLVSRLGGHSFPRTHRGKEKMPGMTITYALMETIEDLSIAEPHRVKLIKKARVTSLIKENGAVVGVEYEHHNQPGVKVQAWGPVVLATGGYAADFSSDSLLKKVTTHTIGYMCFWITHWGMENEKQKGTVRKPEYGI